MDERLTVSYFYCSVIFTFWLFSTLTFLQTYSLINCLCLNKLLSPGSENLAAYVQVIFFLLIFMLRTSAPVRLFSISFLCLSPESGESGCKRVNADVTTSAFVTTNVLINGERINK